MAGSISSLGIGSGVLTSDVLDQLRAADEANLITPLDRKIEVEKQKATAYNLLDTLMTTFKSSVSSLSYDSLYQNRTVDVTGGDLGVKAEAGSDVGTFTLETVALAKKEIQQSGAFASTGDTVAAGPGTMTIAIGGSSYDIAYTDTMTLSELAQAINDAAGSKLTASVLQTGTGAYSLVLSSDTTGADQAITVTDTPDVPGSGLAAALTSGMATIQNADDATFKYNGITITRTSNEVSDLINGVTLTLKTEGEFANVTVKQDQDAIATELKLLVENYNNLITNLSDMTSYNAETGATGVFNGNNFIKSIAREINAVITSVDGENNSLVNYGIEIDRYGVMSFDETAFKAKMNDDPAAVEAFFAGSYDTTTGATTTGIFERLNDKLTEFTGYNGLMDNFKSDMDTRLESMNDQRSRLLASLDTRYAILEKQFIAYDAIISKLNAQFQSLQQMIDAAANSNN